MSDDNIMDLNVDLFAIIYGPNDIFKKKAEIVGKVDDHCRLLARRMLKTLYAERAVGLGANMVGLLTSIVVVDLQEGGRRLPYILINPKITSSSSEMQTVTETSLSFPGISVDVTRPKKIEVEYLDYEGEKQSLSADGFFSSVLQHEIDYLNGKTFLDYVSKLKRDLLIKKVQKHLKLYPPHIHTGSCSH